MAHPMPTLPFESVMTLPIFMATTSLNMFSKLYEIIISFDEQTVSENVWKELGWGLFMQMEQSGVLNSLWILERSQITESVITFDHVMKKITAHAFLHKIPQSLTVPNQYLCLRHILAQHIHNWNIFSKAYLSI